MLEPFSIWLKFAVCAALILVAGTRLSRDGAVIAEKTGLGRAWIGLVLLASVTSLPELVTGISAVTAIDAPDIALGDVMGSLVFNLAILFVLDVLHPNESIFSKARQGHVLSAGFGVVLIGMAGFSVLLAQKSDALSFGHVGIYTPVLLLAYLLAMRALFRYERDVLAQVVRRNPVRRGRHFAARTGRHAGGVATRRARHGHCEPPGEQPVRYRDHCH